MTNQPMRKKQQQMTQEEIMTFLNENNIGHLATLNEDGTPYVLGINYAMDGNNFILHCAKAGHKLDNIAKNNKVCFEVAHCSEIVPSDKSCALWGVRYKSVIAWGKARLCTEEERRPLLELFTNYYMPKGEKAVLPDAGVRATEVIIIEVEKMTGKKSED